MRPRTVLAIGGSDPSGGAEIVELPPLRLSEEEVDVAARP